jgi:Sulfatase
MKPAVRVLAGTVILLAIACVGHQTRNGQTQRPNILLIVSDDVGYADIGMYGSRDIPTPNIDRIGREGIRFTNAYVSGPYQRVAHVLLCGRWTRLARDRVWRRPLPVGR